MPTGGGWDTGYETRPYLLGPSRVIGNESAWPVPAGMTPAEAWQDGWKGDTHGLSRYEPKHMQRHESMAQLVELKRLTTELQALLARVGDILQDVQ